MNFLIIEVEPILSLFTLAQCVLNLHAVAKKEFTFTVRHLLAAKYIPYFFLTFPSALQMQLIEMLLQLDLFFVVVFGCLLVYQSQVFTVEVFWQGIIFTKVVHLFKPFD